MLRNREFNNMLKGYNMMLYFAGTMIMFDPSNECIYDFWSEGILKKLPVKSSNPEFIKASSLLRQSVEEKSVYPRMKEDYRRLFDEKGTRLAYPVKSFYTSDLNLVERETVGEFYKSYGWTSRFRDTIPDDHIGIELLFLTLMIDKLLDFDDEVCNKEMKKEIQRFISDHIINWIPYWTRSVHESAMSASYKGIASLILSSVEDISAILGQKPAVN